MIKPSTAKRQSPYQKLPAPSLKKQKIPIEPKGFVMAQTMSSLVVQKVIVIDPNPDLILPNFVFNPRDPNPRIRIFFIQTDDTIWLSPINSALLSHIIMSDYEPSQLWHKTGIQRLMSLEIRTINTDITQGHLISIIAAYTHHKFQLIRN